MRKSGLVYVKFGRMTAREWAIRIARSKRLSAREARRRWQEFLFEKQDYVDIKAPDEFARLVVPYTAADGKPYTFSGTFKGNGGLRFRPQGIKPYAHPIEFIEGLPRRTAQLRNVQLEQGALPSQYIPTHNLVTYSEGPYANPPRP